MVEHVKNKGWRAYASWTDRHGQRRRKQKQWFATKKAALAWEESIEAENRDMSPDADKITVEQWLARYLELQSGILADNTVSGYRANITAINRYIGTVPLRELRKIDIELMFQRMSGETVHGGKPIRLKTLQYRMRTLRVALNSAIESGYISRNPCTRIKMPVVDNDFTPRLLTAEQGGQLLGFLSEEDEQLYLMVLLSIVYGLRRGEALGLRWCDVDAHELRIRGQYTTGSQGAIWKAALKTSSSYRTLAMQPYIWSVLSAVADANRKTGRIATYVCELDGELPSPNAVTKRWTTFAKRHGVEGVRYHDLRHSSAMMMIQSGEDINAVKQQLGHAKISTTEMYLHADFNQSDRAAAAVVAQIISPPEERETVTI